MPICKKCTGIFSPAANGLVLVHAHQEQRIFLLHGADGLVAWARRGKTDEFRLVAPDKLGDRAAVILGLDHRVRGQNSGWVGQRASLDRELQLGLLLKGSTTITLHASGTEQSARHPGSFSGLSYAPAP